MKKLVINTCYGGFGLSENAKKRLGLDDDTYDWEIERDDTGLIAVVEEMGEKANGSCACLEIVELPNEATDYYINDYDGAESVIYVFDGKIHFA